MVERTFKSHAMTTFENQKWLVKICFSGQEKTTDITVSEQLSVQACAFLNTLQLSPTVLIIIKYVLAM
jgi:hypothetical protein